MATKTPQAGGVLIAMGTIIGSFIGLLIGEPTAGFLVGLAAGAGMSLAIWQIDRRR